jgi:hypothetical protein
MASNAHRRPRRDSFERGLGHLGGVLAPHVPAADAAIATYCVRTPIIGRPRPLPGDRRAELGYTLICDEPDYAIQATDSSDARHPPAEPQASLSASSRPPLHSSTISESLRRTGGWQSMPGTASVGTSRSRCDLKVLSLSVDAHSCCAPVADQVIEPERRPGWRPDSRHSPVQPGFD